MNRIRKKREWVKGVVEKYELPLISYAKAKIGDLERAREAVQSTFLKLWEADRARIEDHLAQWLYTVCRNRVIDMLRKESRMTPVEESQLARVPHSEAGPGEKLEKKQETDQVIGLVGKLPEKQQEVLRLRFQNGFSYREISGITGLSVSNVGFLIHTGIRTLRSKLEPASQAAEGRSAS
jgi:RNA polymerase sigma factor (sigma-70 family)